MPSFDISTYQVAATLLLDERHDDLLSQDQADPNTYTLGRIGNHHVVIACLPSGQYGTTSASMVANHMVRTFSTSLRVGLMVGIGGGIPSKLNDVRLGDIVVSHPDGTSGGVIQYDLGSTLSDGSYKCAECGRDGVITRSARPSDDPVVHYGVIASGNSVIKSAHVRKWLKDTWKALCVEMEAAGLMNDFPCLVIRGICDYSDSHKHKSWQGYAALVAASYAKNLLQFLSTAELREGKHAADICLKLAFKQRERHRSETREAEAMQERFECLRAFSTPRYRDYKDVNPMRIQGTCEWLLSNPKYHSWLDDPDHKLLWVSADPGCGKSVLSKSLIDEQILKLAGGEADVCYFFFKDNDEQNGLCKALCAILHQIFSKNMHLLVNALGAWRRLGPELIGRAHDLWQILIAALEDPQAGCWVLLLDALDECKDSDKDNLMDMLTALAATTAPSLRILVTSRPYDDLRQRFATIARKYPLIHMKGEDADELVRREINIVIQAKVAGLALDFPTERERLTYLWLYLVLDDIKGSLRHSLRPEEQKVPVIVPTVNAAYQKILDRIEAHQLNLAVSVLQVIVGARRPLHVEELAIAVGIADRPHAKSIKQARLNPTGLMDRIRRLCGLFVFFNDSKAYLLHQTAKEFPPGGHSASKIWVFDVISVEEKLAKICMSYLALYSKALDATEGLCKGYSMIESLLDYAEGNIHDHAQGGSFEVHDELLNNLERICSAYNGFDRLLIDRSGRLRLYRSAGDLAPILFAIRLAIRQGDLSRLETTLVSVVSASGEAENHNLIHQAITILDSKGIPLVDWCLQARRTNLAEAVIARGADISLYFPKLMVDAARTGDMDALILLIKYGPSADIDPYSYGFCFAASAGAPVEFFGVAADPELCNKYPGSDFLNRACTALMMAIKEGHDGKRSSDAAESSLELQRTNQDWRAGWRFYAHGHPLMFPVHVHNDKGADQCILLAKARGRYDRRIITLLIEGGIDVNARDIHGVTPLSYPAGCGYHGVCQQLVEAGAAVNAICRGIEWLEKRTYTWMGTALHHAVSSRSSRTVRSLISVGTDVRVGRETFKSEYVSSEYDSSEEACSEEACSEEACSEEACSEEACSEEACSEEACSEEACSEEACSEEARSQDDLGHVDPLLLAALLGFDDIAEILLEAGAVPTTRHLRVCEDETIRGWLVSRVFKDVDL
ncbi:hypothetical protein KVT40_002234 [Elsinoe batatas]|uniref:NACHT domain-containing protein n=1 Tax=Elsinoe batatas TaxID=2601811 RepID=A0A8K0PFS1_9PEZI|nr:hypothetical protein KVT40_002234 [Elsinoe batatas]